MKYLLELNQKELNFIQDAIERTSRLYTGQLDYALEGITERDVPLDYIRDLTPKLYNLAPGAYYGIGSKPQIKQLYNLLQAIRRANVDDHTQVAKNSFIDLGNNGFPTIRIYDDKGEERKDLEYD